MIDETYDECFPLMDKETQLLRFNDSIAIMERAKEHGSLRMHRWQTNPDYGQLTLFNNEIDFHRCGNTACFAGHVAISPEFKADGGEVNYEGSPVLGYESQSSAIAIWLGISLHDASLLVYGNVAGGLPVHSRYYNKAWLNVTAEDVIEKLKSLCLKYTEVHKYESA